MPTCRGFGLPASSKFLSFCAAFCVAECSVSILSVCVCVLWWSVAPLPALWGEFCTMCLWFSGSFQGKIKHRGLLVPHYSPITHPLHLPFFFFFAVTLPSSQAHLIAALYNRKIHNCGKCSHKKQWKGETADEEEKEEEEEGGVLEKGFLFGLNTLCEKEWAVRKRKAGNEFIGCRVCRSGYAKCLMHSCLSSSAFIWSSEKLKEVFNAKWNCSTGTELILKLGCCCG